MNTTFREYFIMINSLYDKFKHWSDSGSVYIISDTHFDDPDSILMDPSWPSAEEQINILKKTIHKNDTLIHLGDVGNIEWIKKLNCYKVLIMGNHDAGKSRYLRKEEYTRHLTLEGAMELKKQHKIDTFTNICGELVGIKDNKLFDEVYEGPLMISEKILLSHEPILGLDWCMNIHGHDHNNTPIPYPHINLASNVCNYTPLNLGKFTQDGGLKEITTIHRQTIDKAIERKYRNE